MSESVNERGSLTSELGEVDLSSDDLEVDDQRIRFFLSYLKIVYGTTPIAFKKGSRASIDCRSPDDLRLQLFSIMKSTGG